MSKSSDFREKISTAGSSELLGDPTVVMMRFWRSVCFGLCAEIWAMLLTSETSARMACFRPSAPYSPIGLEAASSIAGSRRSTSLSTYGNPVIKPRMDGVLDPKEDRVYAASALQAIFYELKKWNVMEEVRA